LLAGASVRCSTFTMSSLLVQPSELAFRPNLVRSI
jgi:hypothetical protein